MDIYPIGEVGPEGISEKTGRVGSPCRSHPAETLAQIPRVRTNSRLDRSIVRILELNFPAVANNPTCNEVVIVRVQRTEETEEESFILEFRPEGRVSEDLSAICCSTSGDDEDTTVDVVGCSYFEVVALEVEAADEVPEALEVDSSWFADDTLVCTDDTDVDIFEGCENGGQKIGRRPEDGGIDTDYDLSLDVWHGVADLDALIASALLYDLDLVTISSIDRSADLPAECEVVPTNGGNDDSSGIIGEHGAKTFLEL